MVNDEGVTSDLNYADTLWKAADTLRGQIDAAEYKHVVLGLLFLKYISDSFESRRDDLRTELTNEGIQGEQLERLLESRDEYTAERVFWVPPEARWSNLQNQATRPDIATLIDDAILAVERDNANLKGKLPRDYARRGIDPVKFKGLIDLIAGIGFKGIMASGPKNSPLWVDPDTWDRRTRVGNYLNCWNLSSQDNMALWQLYGGASNSVVITSTVGDLAATAIRWDRDVFIHKVTYIDHFKNPDMVVGRWHDLLRYKHVAYAFEEEIRFVVPQQGSGWQDNPEELRLPVENLNSLIRSVVVAPEAKPWFFDLVMDVTRKYGVTKPVRRSKLSFMPK